MCILVKKSTEMGRGHVINSSLCREKWIALRPLLHTKPIGVQESVSNVIEQEREGESTQAAGFWMYCRTLEDVP